MKVINKRNGSVLAEGPLIANSFFSRLRGLMFRSKFPKPILFFFDDTAPKRNSIHSFFVFFPFDAIYLDENKVVVDIFENVRPFTPYLEPKKRTKYLIEMDSGDVKKYDVAAGDTIEF